jgi:hypothetical protein
MEIKKRKLKMENYNDFQVGDKVHDLMFGNGFVNFVSETKNRIVVKFSEEYTDIDDMEGFRAYYNLKGQLQAVKDEDEEDYTFCTIITNKTLFHGHNLIVDVNEHKPKRPNWVAIYLDERNGKPYFGELFKEKDEVKIEVGATFITIIELKPYIEKE